VTESRTRDGVHGLLRELAPQVLGAVARRHRDFADAEDAVQEALIAAAEQWPREGVPVNPRGWLYRVAGRRRSAGRRREVGRYRREEGGASQHDADGGRMAPHHTDVGVEQDEYHPRRWK
jgi:predicted RNA polymerase sigma factor